MPLDLEVRAELERRRGEWPRIAAAAGVSHSWVSQFVRGLIPSPRYVTLTRIAAALADTAKAA